VNSRGAASEFAEVIAYATRLAQLIGADLGMDKLIGAECAGERSRYLLHVEDSGHVLAVKANKDADLGSVRTRFGL
jgi:hypothetical protein